MDLYEAVDYTPSRLPPGANSVTVRQFMAHHEGMSLLSLAYVLLGQPMQRRFLADPMLRAADLLLQERVPKATAPVFPHASEASVTRLASAEEAGGMRVFTDPEQRCRGSSFAFQRALPCGGDQRRWRLQPLARSGGHTLARGCHLRQLWKLLLRARCGQRYGVVQRLAADQEPAQTMKRSLRNHGQNSAARTSRSKPTHRSASRRKTTSNSVA